MSRLDDDDRELDELELELELVMLLELASGPKRDLNSGLSFHMTKASFSFISSAFW